VSDISSVVSYWKRKFSQRRYEKKKNDMKDILFLNLDGCSDVYDFIKKYS